MESNFVRDHSSPARRSNHISNVTFGPTSPGSLMSQNQYLSEFNQLVMKQKLNAKFEFLSQEGMSHAPVFKYVLHVNDSTYNGSGSTKKEAQNQAVKAYFDQMAKEADNREQNNSVQSDNTTTGNSEVEEEKMSVVYTRVPLTSNYVGQLHELCAKSNLRPPNYEFTEDSATKKYLATCKVGDMVTQGESSSKKDAKKISSMNMILEIEKKNSNVAQINPTDSIKEPPETKKSKLGEKRNLVPLDSTHKKEIASFRKTLTKTNDLTSFLMNLDVFSEVEINFVKLLMDVAYLHNFEVSYEASGADGDTKVWIVQLGTFPVIVVVGIGKTDEDAKNDASKNVLIYLKALLK